MTGHRMSSLPIAQHCGQGPRLSQMGSGAAAQQSTAYHAHLAGDPGAPALLARLTDEQQAEIATWQAPTTIVLDADNGVILDFADAEKEVELGLDASGRYCEPQSPECVCVGHMDEGWVKTVGGAKVAYVADNKRTRWTASDGPRSLQLMAYMLAYADKHGCDYGCCGIWDLSGGQWQWGDLIDLSDWSGEADAIRARVVASARNSSSDYVMGTHCDGCYGRKRCPAYLMPPELAETSLAEFTTGQLTGENAAKALLVSKRIEATLELVKDACKAYVRGGGTIQDPESGKVWMPVAMPGRASVDTKALSVEMPDIARKYTKQGAGYDMWKWVKA